MFERSDAAYLEAREVCQLEALGCHFVDCEAFPLPHPLRRTKLPLRDAVDVVAKTLPAALAAAGSNPTGADPTAPLRRGLLGILAKVHRRCQLSTGQLEEVHAAPLVEAAAVFVFGFFPAARGAWRSRIDSATREAARRYVCVTPVACRARRLCNVWVASWSLFEVLGEDRRRQFVALRPPPPASPSPAAATFHTFHMVRDSGAVDTRLLPPHTFLLSAENGEDPPPEVCTTIAPLIVAHTSQQPASSTRTRTLCGRPQACGTVASVRRHCVLHPLWRLSARAPWLSARAP
eukprot:1191594-Prorocentrum_minimum.AAC.2